MNRVFAGSVAFAIGLTIILAAVGAPLANEAAPLGIVSYELAGDIARTLEILGAWGPEGQTRAGVSLGLDFLYIPVYATALATGCWLVGNRYFGVFSAAARSLAAAQAAAGLLDVVENVALIRLLFGELNPALPVVARASAMAKFTIVGAGLTFLLAGALFGLLLRHSLEGGQAPGS